VLNGRYLAKRVLFLAAVMKTLQLANKQHLKTSNKAPEGAQELYTNINVVYFKGESRKPILQLQAGFSSDYTVRLFPAVSPPCCPPVAAPVADYAAL
jgi:hypothetical protein